MTFVLGGGGGPGMAFHCGALKAIEDETGLRLADADLAIGTSAGAVVASRLASGHSLAEMMQPGSSAESSLLVPRWGSRVGLARNAVGAGLAVARHITRLPASRHVLAPIERIFPPGMFTIRGWEAAGLADSWPDQPLWLVTIDTNTNRRVVLHRLDDGERQAPLQR
ncbi:MAG: patatin-like phospholipase family protein, partial [Actinomycetota bacterium]|nr:patatin-like phospholipase family protein [Actinomycetota bacterium]